MNWLLKISQLENLKLTDECTGYHHGQTDCVIKAILDNQVIGYLSYSIFEGQPNIQHVEVHEDFRRQGIATAMHDKLKSESEGEIVHTNQTPDGAAWRDSLN